MAKIAFLGGLACEFDLPRDWGTRTLAAFAGPPPRTMLVSKASKLRTSFTVSSAPVKPGDTLEAIQSRAASRTGVDILRDTIDLELDPPRYERIVRFEDPMTGELIQQRHQAILTGARAYTTVLSCQPLAFSSAVKQIAVSHHAHEERRPE